MSLLIISGGQSGADVAGWKAAKRLSIPTTGWMPKGYLTEYGPRPEYAELYNAKEHFSPQYPPRTFLNAGMGQVTLWFGRGDSRGYACTERACRQQDRPIWSIPDWDSRDPEDVAESLIREGFTQINCAGNRESSSPGIEGWVEEYLSIVFGLLKIDNA